MLTVVYKKEAPSTVTRAPHRKYLLIWYIQVDDTNIGTDIDREFLLNQRLRAR